MAAAATGSAPLVGAGAQLRKKLTFAAKERTPSPTEEQPKPAAGKKINAANLFGGDDDSDEEEKKVAAPKPPAKKINTVFNNIDDDDEEEEKKVAKPAPKKLVKDEGSDFKNNLAAMLARGPPARQSARVLPLPKQNSEPFDMESMVESRL